MFYLLIKFSILHFILKVIPEHLLIHLRILSTFTLYKNFIILIKKKFKKKIKIKDDYKTNLTKINYYCFLS